ncbi:MAG TPA: PEP/pyruvate-binding domain-containing protein [Bryobacteraceae bacterium]|nr:PEP/pyruvate-binding domain-containing protein [Bryobacteraceae bacterium]
MSKYTIDTTEIPVASRTITRHFVVELSRKEAEALPDVGGKGANLCRMIRAGLPVPPGFCITTDAYAAVSESAAIDFAAFRTAGTEELKRLAERARAALLAAPMPPDVAAAISDAYRRLGIDSHVAVRSSATAEDLPSASFAGQQDTYLNIVGVSALLDAVRRCWASLWTDRAVIYRSTNGIEHRSVRLAVVVQQMVQAEIAGVMFTANPVTGRRHQVGVDASPGLGEAVVVGSVNPGHFVVDPSTGEILERRLGDKRFAVRIVVRRWHLSDRERIICRRGLRHRPTDSRARRTRRQSRGVLPIASGHRVGC